MAQHTPAHALDHVHQERHDAAAAASKREALQAKDRVLHNTAKSIAETMASRPTTLFALRTVCKAYLDLRTRAKRAGVEL